MKTRRNIVLVALVALCILISGCALSKALQGDKEMKPKEVYHEALKWYNFNLEQYLDYYDAAPESIQMKWKTNIDPWFKKADKALEAWKSVLDAPGEQEKIEVWISIKNELVMLLISQGIITEE